MANKPVPAPLMAESWMVTPFLFCVCCQQWCEYLQVVLLHRLPFVTVVHWRQSQSSSIPLRLAGTCLLLRLPGMSFLKVDSVLGKVQTVFRNQLGVGSPTSQHTKVIMGRRRRRGLLRRLGIKKAAKKSWKSAGRALRPAARGFRKLAKKGLKSAGDIALLSAQQAMGGV